MGITRAFSFLKVDWKIKPAGGTGSMPPIWTPSVTALVPQAPLPTGSVSFQTTVEILRQLRHLLSRKREADFVAFKATSSGGAKEMLAKRQRVVHFTSTLARHTRPSNFPTPQAMLSTSGIKKIKTYQLNKGQSINYVYYLGHFLNPSLNSYLLGNNDLISK